MAKISSAKRGAVPNDSIPPVRRMTRSQSVEPKVAPDMPQWIESVDVDAGDMMVPSPLLPELTTVQEESESTGSPSERGEDGSDHAFIQKTNFRASIASGISGTTAKTSFSQEEIMDLDAEIMVDALPRLAADVNDLKETIAPSEPSPSPEVWKEIRRSGSTQNKLYRKRLQAVEIHKSDFGSQEYIEPRNVIRAMLGVQTMDEVPLAVWRPDDILFKINLVHMLSSLLITCDSGNQTDTHIGELERLDVAFPSAIAGSKFDTASLRFYLDMAAQLAIARLDMHISSSEPRFSPSDVIDSVLYDDGEFKYTSALGLDDIEEPNRRLANSMVSRLARDLKRPFGKMDPEKANAHLKSKFQWFHFTSHALQYFSFRKRDLDDRINAAGGVGNIVSGLAQELENRAALRASGQPVPKYAKRKSNASTRSLKELERELQNHPPVLSASERPSEFNEQADGGEVDESDTRSAPLPGFAPPSVIPQANMVFVDDDDFVPIGDQPDYVDEQQEMTEREAARRGPSPRKPSQFATLQASQQANADRKLKSLMDKQQNAVRIPWDQSQPTQNQGPPVDVSSLSRRTKRPLAEVEQQDEAAEDEEQDEVEEDEEQDELEEDEEPEAFEPTQDAGFQTDTRSIAAANRRRKAAPPYKSLSLTPPRPSFRSASARAASASASTKPVISRNGAGPSPKRQRKNPGSSIPAASMLADRSDGDLPSSTMYQEAKKSAKINRALSSKPKIQTRIPWTDEEEEVLMNLIEKDSDGGVSYSKLKHLDEARENLLHLRDAESLRFKARNMKVTLLECHKSPQALHPNWAYVMLGRKELDTLRQWGVFLEQNPVRNVRRG